MRCANVPSKVEVEAGETAPVHTREPAGLWWRGRRGALRALWPCPSSAGLPLGGLEVVVAPVLREEAEEDTEVTRICQFLFLYVVLPTYFILARLL